jgi:hypothetical protein
VEVKEAAGILAFPKLVVLEAVALVQDRTLLGVPQVQVTQVATPQLKVTLAAKN